MFKTIKKIIKSNEEIKNNQKDILNKKKEFENQWDYLGKKNLTPGKKLP